MDGFDRIPISRLEEGSVLNIEPYRNEYSPFSRVYEAGPAIQEDDVLVDTFYGLSYDPWVRNGGAPYGLTNELPVGPLDHLAVEYSRIPFARVPCIKASDKAGLLQLVLRVREAYPDLTLLFRGQTKEYLLDRNIETLKALYGSEVREPSLLPSAERRNMNIDAVGPSWCGMLRWLLDVWATRRGDTEQFQQIHEAGEDYFFHHFALAIAQHYGLPSSGVDVTDSLDVALFFALHRFSPSQHDPNLSTCSRVLSEGSAPVLYIFGIEMEKEYIRYESSLLGELPTNRPARQAAFFLHRGAGFARNRAARNLLAALYVDPTGDYGVLPGVDHLFPGPEEDFLGLAIENTKRHLNDSLPELNRFLKDFAWVRVGAD